MQVGRPELPGYGGQAAKPIGWQDSPNGNGGTGPGVSPPSTNGAGPFTPSTSIPGGFWGYVMLVVGMR